MRARRLLPTPSPLLAATLLAAAASLAVVTAAEKAKLTSPWRDRDITIDGASADWTELTPLAKSLRLSLGLANDQDHLYLALETSDPFAGSQILQQGLIVWFDAQGGKKKQIGIRFPTGPTPDQARSAGSGRRSADRDGRGGSPSSLGQSDRLDGGLGPGAYPDVSRLFTRAEAEGRLRRFEILAEGRDAVAGSLDAPDPLALRIGWADGSLLYELRIPLARMGETPGVGAQPGGLFGLGLETPKMDAGSRSGPGGGPGMGGMGGMGGGMGGRRGRPMPLPEPLKFWTTVRLAPAPVAK